VVVANANVVPAKFVVVGSTIAIADNHHCSRLHSNALSYFVEASYYSFPVTIARRKHHH
jgi:hypothetical protein